MEAFTLIRAQEEGWAAIDGIRWTPWGRLPVAEETTGDRLFEILPDEDMMSAAEVIDRSAASRLAHEGIEVCTKGNIYVVDLAVYSEIRLSLGVL